jgi:hypothetical protein
VRLGAPRALVLLSSLVAAASLGGACSSASVVAPPPVTDAGASAHDAHRDQHHADRAIVRPTVTGPQLHSETGLYEDFRARTLAAGVVAYAPRYSFWSDGAEKNRFFSLPPGSQIDTREMDEWAFPVGTKVWKEFKVGGSLVETRMLWKQQDAGYEGWWMAAYVWRSDGSDADATLDGLRNFGGTSHDVPSQEECVKCHMDVKDVLIGVSAIQLSTASGNGMLSRLASESRLTSAPVREFQVPGTGVVQDALAYLHANCSHCHNGRQQVLANQSPLRLQVRTVDAAPEQTPAYTTAMRTKMRHEMPGGVDLAIVPGQPDRSQLWLRIQSRDSWMMPPLGTKQVDPASDVVRQWIAGLP